MAATLRNLRIERVDLVDKGANQGAHVVLVKRDVKKDGPSLSAVHVDKPIGDEHEVLRTIDSIADEFADEYEDSEPGRALKAVMTSGTRNALPDSAFAAVWTDADGKKQRKLPFKHKDGSVDLPHLRNALARLSSVKGIPAEVRGTARHKLEAAAKTHGVGEQNKRDNMANTSMLKRFMIFMAKEAAFGAKEAEAEAARKEAEAGAHGDEEEVDEEKEAMGPENAKLPQAHLKYLKGLHGHLGKMVQDAAGADGTHDHLPPEHPIHKVKELHKAIGEMLGAYGQEPGDPGEADWENEPDEGGPKPFGREPASRNALTKREVAMEKRIVAAEKRAAAAERVARDEQTLRARGEMSTSLRKFKGVSVDPTKDAETFLTLKTEKPEVYKRVMEVLNAADATIAKDSTMFQELGSPRGADAGGNTAWARIEAEAEKLVTKDTKMTKAKAIELVMKRRTDLVREYYAENRAAQ